MRVNDACECGHEIVSADTFLPSELDVVRCTLCLKERVSYTRHNSGNHPDHPPVEGGYRGDK